MEWLLRSDDHLQIATRLCGGYKTNNNNMLASPASTLHPRALATTKASVMETNEAWKF